MPPADILRLSLGSLLMVMASGLADPPSKEALLCQRWAKFSEYHSTTCESGLVWPGIAEQDGQRCFATKETMITMGRQTYRKGFYRENGATAYIGAVKKGVPEGPWYFYRQDGSLLAAGNYTNAKPSGAWALVAPDGMRLIEGSYVAGLPDGVWMGWSPKALPRQVASGAVLQFQKLFDKGKPVGSWLILEDPGRLLPTAIGPVQHLITYQNHVPQRILLQTSAADKAVEILCEGLVGARAPVTPYSGMKGGQL